MEKSFPIDFVRQTIEQTLELEHNLNPDKYFGGKNQINLFSFYEQLEKEEEINRYVEIYRDLSEQQNRTGLIMNGTIVAPENPTITNLWQSLIIPMSYTCSFRVRIEDRDMATDTINNLIKKLKGKKVDIAELNTGKLFAVGTYGNHGNILSVENGDYLRSFTDNDDVDGGTSAFLQNLEQKGFWYEKTKDAWYYASLDGVIKVVYYNFDDDEYKFVDEEDVLEKELKPLFPPQHTSFEKCKLSLSFDSIRCDEPRNLNANEYCVISFGGSATLTSQCTALGNDMIKLLFTKYKIKSSPDISLSEKWEILEPLELPSGNSADTQLNQLISNKFVNNSHTDSLSLSLQYTFIVDRGINLINQFFKYGRYGTQGTQTLSYTDGITPNMIFKVREIWNTWGELEINEFKAKIIESVDIENTESDTLTITIPLQLQGDN